MAAGSGWRRGVGTALPLLVAIGYGVWHEHRARSRVFTSDERAPLVAVERDGRRRLVHPTLGFSVLHPGPGFVATGSQAFASDAQFYAFADQAAGQALTIGVFKGQGESPWSLRKLVDQMGAHASVLAGGSDARVRVDRMDVPDADPPRGELHAIIGKSRHYTLRAYGWNRPKGPPIAVVIAMMAASPDAHADVLASFEPVP
jgi:hypothetical protein